MSLASKQLFELTKFFVPVPSSESRNCKLHREGRCRGPSQGWKSALILRMDRGLGLTHGGVERPSVVRAQEDLSEQAFRKGGFHRHRWTSLVQRLGRKGPRGRGQNSIQRGNSRSSRSGHKGGLLAGRVVDGNEETRTERGQMKRGGLPGPSLST